MEDSRVVIFLVMLGICFTKADEGSVYFIAGGTFARRNIELYHPTIEDLNCTITPPTLNKDWRNHMTFYHDNTIYLCGGTDTKSTCISHSKDTDDWKVHTLSSPRWDGHSTVVLENTLYIIGGSDGTISSNNLGAFSTPLPLTDQPVLTSVPNLSYKGSSQCVAKVDNNNLIVTGGYIAQGSVSSSVIQYNAKTSTVTTLTSLKVKRYLHGCVVVEMDKKKYLIVTGGWVKGWTTEMIDLEGNSHVSLGHLHTTRPRYFHSMIAAKVGVLVIGGQDGNGAIKTVEMLDWTTKKWKPFEKSIKTARYLYGGVVAIPASMFNCLGITTTQASTTPITTCPPPPTCPTPPPPPTCPTVPATQTCPPTPTCPDKTCPTVPTPSTPTCPTVSAPSTVPPPPTCKKNKKCARKKGKCFGKGDTVPPNAQRKGWCSKKKGCKCYKV